MSIRRLIGLVVFCGVVAACAYEAGGRKVQVVGTVVGFVWPQLVVSGRLVDRPCDDRLLFRVARTRGPFRAGEYLVLQSEGTKHPCQSAEAVFSGRDVWRFTVSPEARSHGPLERMLPVMGAGEERTVDTPDGPVTVSPYGNLTMLDGGRIEDLPLDAEVSEYSFKEYERVKPTK